MRASLFILILFSALVSCNTAQKEKEANVIEDNLPTTGTAERDVATISRGYELMQQKCYICHIEKPDPSLRGQMIAPPMVNVREHYEPSYSKKDEFINAMVSFIQNPSEEKTLMPGAVKKFNLMPKLIYEETELRLIAEAIYEHDFGVTSQMRMQNMRQNLELNNGKKWDLNTNSLDRINAVTLKLNNFESGTISEYNQLGKEIFDEVKMILLDDSYTGELFDQLHNFFGSLETDMHALISAKDKVEAEKQMNTLKSKLREFYNYFE
ncbi:hypothetical protein [Salinimicrobium soli]|uniref:hypothetical protein n=1 Tax=Salinimicrobium soli TaxID=1254399 RepID=UPI003AAEE383